MASVLSNADHLTNSPLATATPRIVSRNQAIVCAETPIPPTCLRYLTASNHVVMPNPKPASEYAAARQFTMPSFHTRSDQINPRESPYALATVNSINKVYCLTIMRRLSLSPYRQCSGFLAVALF
jgi:hypothetical protein